MADQQGFATVEDAVAAGLFVIDQTGRADKDEFIGLVFQDPDTGKFHFTQPQGQNKSGKSEGTFKIPKGSARAIFHNHPELKDRKKQDRSRDQFSPGDIDLANSTGLLSFIGFDNEIRVFDPSADMGRSGEPVLARIPIGIIDALQQKRRKRHGLPPHKGARNEFSEKVTKTQTN